MVHSHETPHDDGRHDSTVPAWWRAVRTGYKARPSSRDRLGVSQRLKSISEYISHTRPNRVTMREVFARGFQCYGALAVLVSTATAQSGGIQRGLQYGENWVPTTKDSELVAKNFPDVNITLLSPAFLNPETVPEAFSEGKDGPTDDAVLGKLIREACELQSHRLTKQILSSANWLTAIPGWIINLPTSSRRRDERSRMFTSHRALTAQNSEYICKGQSMETSLQPTNRS